MAEGRATQEQLPGEILRFPLCLKAPTSGARNDRMDVVEDNNKAAACTRRTSAHESTATVAPFRAWRG